MRYLVIGTYVGLATVGIFMYWYMYYSWAGDGHTLVSFNQLRNWSECNDWSPKFQVANFGIYDFTSNPCDYFVWGKQKACTLSLTTLVVIEMFNAMNALGEDASLFKIGIISNPFLLLAIFGSVVLHFVILYIPFFANIFGTVPLTVNDWILVIIASFPVCIIEEVLKWISR